MKLVVTHMRIKFGMGSAERPLAAMTAVPQIAPQPIESQSAPTILKPSLKEREEKADKLDELITNQRYWRTRKGFDD